jgi:hypothetical protein
VFAALVGPARLDFVQASQRAKSADPAATDNFDWLTNHSSNSLNVAPNGMII